MAKKKYFNGSYGYIGYVEKLNRHVEFATEKEYLEYIDDDSRVEDTKKFIDEIESDDFVVNKIGIF